MNAYEQKRELSQKEFIKTVEVLLQSVKDDYLSPEDFMERVNNAYNYFGQVTHENHKAECPQCGCDDLNDTGNEDTWICSECSYEDVKKAF